MKKLYLSGPMSIMKNKDIWYNRFKVYEEIFRDKGYNVVNPASPAYEKSYGNNIRRSLLQLLECDCIFFLPESILSNGARIEYEVAKACGMEIVVLDENISFTDNFQTKENIY